MRTAILAFIGGVLWLQWQEVLPESATLWTLAAAAMSGVLAAYIRPSLKVLGPVAAFLFGIAWAGLFATQRLADALDTAWEGRDVEIVGVVAGLPRRLDHGIGFDFDVERAPAGVPGRIGLGWYRGGLARAERQAQPLPEVHAGERWRLTVRLKRPHGNLNPHSFDYEAWLLERGVRATGHVRATADNDRLDTFAARRGDWIERLREAVRTRLDRVLVDQAWGGVIAALAIGDQRAIDGGAWQVFARTGTTHLMSISGLHVTMFASLAWMAVGWLWRRSERLCLRLPAQKAAALAGFLAALGYCLLSGFAVPAQRTLYMLGVVALALWSGRAVAASRVLATALWLVLVIDPWAVLAPGFWLSFGAVALLFQVDAGRLASPGWLGSWLRSQWAVTVGMVPALLALFQQFSLVSPLANAIAIPFISYGVTPLALLGALPGFDAPLRWAHDLMSIQMILLEAMAASPLAVWQQHAPPEWAVGLALLGIAWLLLPRGFPARWLGGVACLPLVLAQPPRPAPGEAWVTVLDVGQGLAAHVRTATRDLLYDTGPVYSEESDGGNRIVAPYLRSVGANMLDGIVVTHADNDHSGGARSILDSVPTGWLMSSLPFEHDLSTVPIVHRECVNGDSWTWDGVRFEVLHPTLAHYANPTRKTNDMSCVLKVTAGRGAMLLTSDIETVSEKTMVARHGARLRADVLLVPHHGSRTSSSSEFVAAVGARDAVFPVGYRNRFGHPKEDVVARYAGVRQWRTDVDGAITVRLGGERIAVFGERAVRRRYWHGR